MRTANRPRLPASLRRNAVRWTRELMEMLSAPNQDRNHVKRLQDRYRKDDIRAALKEMYGGLCCYCESRVGIVDFPHIEHRKPKRLYPELTFNWDNLHLACQVCNQAKGKKWDECYPILDSAKDMILLHLSYRIGTGGVRRWPETGRGKTTVDHATLNRQNLMDARTQVAYNAWKAINILKCDPN